eukprot:scaffold23474_cov144-Skeletonema_dohrnii-CCMP3373.AAC.1
MQQSSTSIDWCWFGGIMLISCQSPNSREVLYKVTGRARIQLTAEISHAVLILSSQTVFRMDAIGTFISNAIIHYILLVAALPERVSPKKKNTLLLMLNAAPSMMIVTCHMLDPKQRPAQGSENNMSLITTATRGRLPLSWTRSASTAFEEAIFDGDDGSLVHRCLGR